MAEIKGCLLKRRGGKFGVHMKNAWQSRHFEIKDGAISYFEDQGKKSKPRGTLKLSETSLEMFTTYEHAPPFSYSFEVIPVGKEEKWRLCAHNKVEMDLWCDTLRKYVVDVTDLSVTSTFDLLDNPKEMTGFLLKRRGGTFGSHMKNAWQGRYFEIKNDTICYYEDEGETSKPRGQMTLKGTEVSLVKNTTYENAAPSVFTFELIPLPPPGGGSAEEKWRLCATTEEEMNHWCACIQECLGVEDTGTMSATSDSGSGHGNKKHSPSSSTDAHNTKSSDSRKEEATSHTDSDVYGGDNVVMSLAWQKRSARTMSGVDRVACEAVARAMEKQITAKGGDLDSPYSGALEFDDLEVDEEEEEEEERSSFPLRVRVNSQGENITIGGEGDNNSVYVHDSPDESNVHSETSPTKSLDMAKRWMSKRKTQLSHIITDINSNNQGRAQGDDSSNTVYLDPEPIETEGTYCV
mmetsp:Transcript_26881/g.45361  ORF Transcript_26881/g.45361 Transcript_26881/m.45361 type:complete len:464 (+) Transcript_26881:81-1472(+)